MLRSEEYEIQTSGSGRAGLHRRKRTFRLQEGNETAGRGAYILLCWTGLCPDRRTAEYRRGWHHINGKRDKQEQGRLCLDDLTGASLTSGKNLILYAKGDIRLDSGKVINMETLSGIFAEALAAATSSMCVNGRFDYLSAGTLLKGSTYLRYDPFDDAPKEGKFDWGGFFNNLAFGLKVAAVFAAFALAAITAGAAAVVVGAFVGAAIGAFATTVRISVEDFNSGNVRSESDARWEIGIATVSGAITGALGASQQLGRLALGAINTLLNASGRTILFMATEDMTPSEAFKCAFDPRVLVIDFVVGVVISYVVDGLLGNDGGRVSTQTFDEVADPLFEGAEDGFQQVTRETVEDVLGEGGTGFDNQYCLSGEEHFEALKEIFGTDNVEWTSRDTLSYADRLRIQNWGDNAPIDEIYIKYKDIFQNDLYYNQTTGQILWPADNGFAEYPNDFILMPGTLIDRYGNDFGSFTSPLGTPYEQRALAPGTELKQYSIFEVLQPINVKAGEIASWFNQPGGGMQYQLPEIIDKLLGEFLRRIDL